MYSKALGVPEDKRAAIKWYTLASEQGLPEAQHDLGFMYENGQGVERNKIKAAQFYRNEKRAYFLPKHALFILSFFYCSLFNLMTLQNFF